MTLVIASKNLESGKWGFAWKFCELFAVRSSGILYNKIYDYPLVLGLEKLLYTLWWVNVLVVGHEVRLPVHNILGQNPSTFPTIPPRTAWASTCMSPQDVICNGERPLVHTLLLLAKDTTVLDTYYQSNWFCNNNLLQRSASHRGCRVCNSLSTLMCHTDRFTVTYMDI